MNPLSLATLENILRKGVQGQVFPGAAAALVSDHGRQSDLLAAGFLTPGGLAVSASTLYDLASLTKPFVALAFVRLWARSVMSPPDPVRRWLPEWTVLGADRVRIEHLLSHESGLPAWRPYFEEMPLAERATPMGLERIRQAALSTEIESPPGSRALYSDIGFILLGWALERAAGLPLEEILRKEVLEPLSLKDTLFLPVKSASTTGPVAPTERCPWRNRLIAGEVHDENAWSMGGIAPHAGLFSTASDMATVTASLLRACKGNEEPWNPDLLLQSISRRPMGRTLGWDTPELPGSSAGRSISRSAFGHLGFTGCSIWIDPARGIGSVLLSNRIHPTRANEAIREFRPLFHEACFTIK